MIVFKDNASLKIKADDEGQLRAHGTGHMVPVDTSYHHLFGITIQWYVKARRAYSSINVINYILSVFQIFGLCKIKCGNRQKNQEQN